MRLVAAVLLLALGGCSDFYSLAFGPSDESIASSCGVTKGQLQATRQQVKKLEPYQGRDLGRCTVMRGDGSSDVTVVENWAEVAR